MCKIIYLYKNRHKKILEYLYNQVLNIENNVDTSYQLNRIVYRLKTISNKRTSSQNNSFHLFIVI